MKKNKKIRLTSIVLSSVMMLGTLPFTSYAESMRDLKTSNDKKIEKLVDEKILAGRNNGDLALDKTITRAEMLKTIIYSLGLEKEMDNFDGEIGFTDVSKDHWASKMIAFCGQYKLKNGLAIINGYPDKTFRPDAKISYQEIITILTVIKKSDLDTRKVKSAKYPDDFINWAKELKIIGNEFGIDIKDFQAHAKRRDVFVMLYNSDIPKANSNIEKNEEKKKENKKEISSRSFYNPYYYWNSSVNTRDESKKSGEGQRPTPTPKPIPNPEPKPKEVDKTELKAKITEAETKLKDSAKYEEATVTALENALKAAKEVVENKKATKKDIDGALAKLSEKINALKLKITPQEVDKKELKAKITEAETILKDSAKYEEATITALENALKDAKEVVKNKDATKKDIDDALAKLSEKINALKLKITPQEVDKTALKAKITEAETKLKDSAKYEEATITALENALKAAKEVAENKKATKKDIDDALAKLSEKINALKLKITPQEVDKTALKAKITEAETKLKDSAKYEEATITALENALKDAKEVVKNKDATKEMVDRAISELKEKIEALKEKKEETEDLEKKSAKVELKAIVDKSVVLVEKGRGTNEEEIWDNFTERLDLAKEILEGTEDIKVSQIKKYTEELTGLYNQVKDKAGTTSSEDENASKDNLKKLIDNLNEYRKAAPKTMYKLNFEIYHQWGRVYQYEMFCNEYDSAVDVLTREGKIGLSDAIKAMEKWQEYFKDKKKMAFDKMDELSGIASAILQRDFRRDIPELDGVKVALDAQKPLRSDKNATTEQFENAADKLEKAINAYMPVRQKKVATIENLGKDEIETKQAVKFGLKGFIPDSKYLQNLTIVVDGNPLDLEKYTVDFKKNTVEIKAEVFENPKKYTITFANEEYQDKTFTIYVGVKKELDKKPLTDKITEIERRYKEENYESKGFNNLKTGLAKAKTLLTKVELTENEMNEMISELDTLVGKLVTKQSETPKTDSTLTINLKMTGDSKNYQNFAGTSFYHIIADADNTKWTSGYFNDNAQIMQGETVKIKDGQGISLIHFQAFDGIDPSKDIEITVNGEKVDLSKAKYEGQVRYMAPIVLLPEDSLTGKKYEYKLLPKNTVNITINFPKNNENQNTGDEDEEDEESYNENIYVLTNLDGDGFISYYGKIKEDGNYGDFIPENVVKGESNPESVAKDIDVFKEISSMKGFKGWYISSPGSGGNVDSDPEEDEILSTDQLKNRAFDTSDYGYFAVGKGGSKSEMVRVIAIFDENSDFGFLKNISTDDALKMIKEKSVKLLDVRTNGEFTEGRIKYDGILHSDWTKKDSFEEYIDDLDRDETYLIYCRTQVRSKEAADFMKENGFKKLYYMEGGITKWLKEADKIEFTEFPKSPLALDLTLLGNKNIYTKEKLNLRVSLTNNTSKKEGIRKGNVHLELLNGENRKIEEKDITMGDNGDVEVTFDLTKLENGNYKIVAKAQREKYKDANGLFTFKIADKEKASPKFEDRKNAGAFKHLNESSPEYLALQKYYGKNILQYSAKKSNSDTIKLADFIDSSKPTVLMFGYPGCGGCKTMMNRFSKINHEKYNYVEVITSVGENLAESVKDTEKVLENLKADNLKSHILYDGEDFIWKSRLDLLTTPNILFIDTEGRLVDMSLEMTLPQFKDRIKSNFDLDIEVPTKTLDEVEIEKGVPESDKAAFKSIQGKSLAEVELINIDGEKVKLKEAVDGEKPTLLIFSSTSCGNCHNCWRSYKNVNEDSLTFNVIEGLIDTDTSEYQRKHLITMLEKQIYQSGEIAKKKSKHFYFGARDIWNMPTKGRFSGTPIGLFLDKDSRIIKFVYYPNYNTNLINDAKEIAENTFN